jgi:NAD(P) transhydrogenase subunit alpha
MNIITRSDAQPKETRIAMTPQSAAKLTKLGAAVHIPKDYGKRLGFADSDFEAAGATVHSDIDGLIPEAELIVLLNAPDDALLAQLRQGQQLVALLDPFRNLDTVRSLRDKGVSSLCMELIPRSTYAQKMDALSSQASLAGYAAVIAASDRIAKVLPMMSTPAGTIAPARVFVIGAGVAGLQAIATARRLGARVEAYDTRPVVEEQVQSLGAKFVKIDVGETGQTEQGYAKALTPEQLARQREQMAKFVASADIVITTAQVFGREAPRIVTREMVKAMRPGSVIVDLAASTGGNVEGTVADKEVSVAGVKIIGLTNFAGTVAKDASQMYASNVANLIEHIWDKERGEIVLDTADDIVDNVLLTHDGAVRHARIKELLEGGSA